MRMNMIDCNFPELSLRSQFDLLNLNRSSYYYQKTEVSEKEQNLANKIYELWIKYPFTATVKSRQYSRETG